MSGIQSEAAFERVKTWLLAVDAATIAVFLATIDSLSAPCGVGSEYYGDTFCKCLTFLALMGEVCCWCCRH